MEIMGVLLKNRKKRASASKIRLLSYSRKCLCVDDLETMISPFFISSQSWKIHRNHRGGFLSDGISLDSLLEDKIIEEIRYERAKKDLAERLRRYLAKLEIRNVEENIINDLNLEDFQNLILTYRLEALNESNQIVEDYEALRNSRNRLRSIYRQIKTVLNKIRKYGRNLKKVFNRHHSFHFKNLDDYHSYILVAKNASRV